MDLKKIIQTILWISILTIGLEAKESETLFDSCISATIFDEQIEILKEGFSESSAQMMKFVKYLNDTILSDSVWDEEHTMFERVRDGLV